VVKKALLDIPVIQPLQTTFDIFPLLSAGDEMPNIFKEGDDTLRVSQTWRLITSISRIGSDKLELKGIRINGGCDAENSSLVIREISSSDEISGLPRLNWS